MNEYTVRLCVDCIHYDVEHHWCDVWNRNFSPMQRHEPPHVCPHYAELFDEARLGNYPHCNITFPTTKH